jgi:hypothetical protein
MITKVVTTLALLPIAFTSPAEALTCNVTSSGVQYCIDGKGNNRYGVTLSKGTEVETFDIQCYGKSLEHYESYGPLSQSDADSFARAFCAL